MNRNRGEHLTLHERIHGTPPPAGSARNLHLSGGPQIRHCWVSDEHGRLPGLLLEWRRTAAGWQGRIVRPVLEDGGWIVVEEWLPAELLEGR